MLGACVVNVDALLVSNEGICVGKDEVHVGCIIKEQCTGLFWDVSMQQDVPTVNHNNP